MTYVLCVTLNPCLDKTLTVPAWAPGDNVRGTQVREVVGGKGNNVARALSRLEIGSTPAIFLGGSTGQRCRHLLRRDDRLDPMAIETLSETRTILTVRTGQTSLQTAFFDPDPMISQSEADQLRSVVGNMLQSSKIRAMTLSGSSPSETTHSLYGEFVEMARIAGVPVFLDTYGPSMKMALHSVPDVLQLNRREIAGALGVGEMDLSDSAMLEWLSRWVERGTRLAVVTQGPRDVLAASAEGYWRVSVPGIEVVNPIGSGDCVLAGLCAGFLWGWNDPGILRHGVACGVANAAVWDAGAIDRPTVSRFSELVDVRRFNMQDDITPTIRRS